MTATLSLSALTQHLDQLFANWRSGDYSNNGLQVEGASTVAKVAFAVDACQETIDGAVAAGAQMLFVHHGISWGGGLPLITGRHAKRIGTLLQNQLSLYAMHLPLDAHPTLGNNGVLAEILGVDAASRQPFGECKGAMAGWAGPLPRPQELEEIAEVLRRNLHNPAVRIFPAPKLPTGGIERIAILSGSGASAIEEAYQGGYQCLITGEMGHQYYHDAREMGISVIAAGHYATEVCGPAAVMKHLTQEFPGLETIFIHADSQL